MYEFDSVSVSAFEAAELAAILTEKSADGWDVAGIVTAGSDVVAFLRRATTSSESAAKEDGTTAAEMDSVKPVSTLAASEPARERETVGASSASDLLAGGSAGSGAAPPSGGTGWGAAANTATSSPSGWGSTEASGSWGGSAQQATAPPPQQVAPAVPAGWYADPAGRFELRYWDGGAWTEHVSRAGQQYTDPPVA